MYGQMSNAWGQNISHNIRVPLFLSLLIQNCSKSKIDSETYIIFVIMK